MSLNLFHLSLYSPHSVSSGKHVFILCIYESVLKKKNFYFWKENQVKETGITRRKIQSLLDLCCNLSAISY